MLLEQLRIATTALRANWFRAMLTALGVIIGVGSLVAVNAVSAGASKAVGDSIRRLGSNVILVDGELIAVGTQTTTSDRTITPEDVAAIAKLPMVTAVAPFQDIEGLAVSAGRNTTTTRLFGITPVYEDIYNQSAAEGRLISSSDVGFGRGVVTLGQVVRRRLFPRQDAVGRVVRVGSQELQVIGVQSRKGGLAGENLDNRIFMPLPIVLRVLLGGANTKSAGVRVRTEADITPAIDEIETLLREQHKLPPSYADDFSTEDQTSLVKEAQSATGTFRVLTFALGGIALLVGGIGIMNMMLVSVHERTREIGIRKSVGATPRNVQAQFLIEALVLSALSGAVGVGAGILATDLIGLIAGWQVLIRTPPLIVAFMVALGIGVFFGYYPARRAARLDPIVALRYE